MLVDPNSTKGGIIKSQAKLAVKISSSHLPLLFACNNNLILRNSIQIVDFDFTANGLQIKTKS